MHSSFKKYFKLKYFFFVFNTIHLIQISFLYLSSFNKLVYKFPLPLFLMMGIIRKKILSSFYRHHFIVSFLYYHFFWSFKNFTLKLFLKIFLVSLTTIEYFLIPLEWLFSLRPKPLNYFNVFLLFFNLLCYFIQCIICNVLWLRETSL